MLARMIRSLLHVGLGTLVCWMLGATLNTPSADAQDTEPSTITFSNLLIRLASKPEISVATEDWRIVMLETLRSEGFKALGAENLVFGVDHSGTADFVLGGTVKELSCKIEQGETDCCRAGVQWELFNTSSEKVTYSAFTRYGECQLGPLDDLAVSQRMIVGTLRSLLKRPRFSEAMKKTEVTSGATTYASAHFERCAQKPLDMDSNADPALDATVLISSGGMHGSGFFITKSGLLLTAAHVVVANKMNIRTRDGDTYTAHPVRISRKFDSALLQLDMAEGAPPTGCLALHPNAKGAGTTVFAIGAPKDKDLAFSLTRGIISSRRELRGADVLQTDTPISPGNSGGPLVDNKGKAVGIVSSKLVADDAEGISFAVPTDVALASLALYESDKSDGTLEAATPLVVASEAAEAFVDRADAMPSLQRREHIRFSKASPGASIVRSRAAAGAPPTLQARLIRSGSRELVVSFVHTNAGNRMHVSVEGWSPWIAACEKVDLAINGRKYDELENVPNGVSNGRASSFDSEAFLHLRDHAPTMTVRTCGETWDIAPSQLDAIRRLMGNIETAAN
jgi:serine protease Do